MQASQTIARLAGPTLSAIGAGLLINNAAYRETALQFLASPPLIYFSGILLLMSGLTILNIHPKWTRDWRSVVTALGWVLTVIGGFRVVAPKAVIFLGIASYSSALIGAGILTLALGAFLSVKGYLA